jgi:hypothetical protein
MPVALLVSFWRSDRGRLGRFAPGDCVVSASRFPTDEDDINELREAVRRIVEPGIAPAEKIVLVNVVRLGEPWGRTRGSDQSPRNA